MPSYPWSCLACGHPNGAAAEVCVHCGCKASCTVDQAERCRARHLAQGLPLGPAPGVLAQPRETSALRILFTLFMLLLFGGWPARARRKDCDGPM